MHFPFWEGIEVSYQVCCYGDIITTTTMCSSCSTTIMQNFKPVDIDIWFSYITLCPHYDITSHPTCTNQNLLQPATKNAITIKQMPFFITWKALPNKLIKNFLSYTP